MFSNFYTENKIHYGYQKFVKTNFRIDKNKIHKEDFEKISIHISMCQQMKNISFHDYKFDSFNFF